MSGNCYNFRKTSDESSFEEIMKRLDSVKESCNANCISPLEKFREKFREKNEEFSELLEELIRVSSTEINFSFGLFSETVESLLTKIEFCKNALAELATTSLKILDMERSFNRDEIDKFNIEFIEAIRNLSNLKKFYTDSIREFPDYELKLNPKKISLDRILDSLNKNIAKYNRKNPSKRIFTEAEAEAASKLEEANVGKKHGLNSLR